MKELEEIKTIKDIENLNLSKPYNWVYLNYDKKEGVKLFKEMDNKEINSLSDKELLDKLVEDVSEFRCGVQEDDIALLSMRVL